MPQTDEWTQAFESWNELDFYDRLLALAGEAEDEEGEFFRAGLAYALSKRFVIYFTLHPFKMGGAPIGAPPVLCACQICGTKIPAF